MGACARRDLRRLERTADCTQVGTYVYDALERLAIRTTSNVTPAGTTHFAHDLSGKVLIEANGANGATVREYVWFNDMPLVIVADVDTASPQLLHVHADHLDRPIVLTNGSKANVWEAVYRPFGEVHAITGTATQNLRFPGQYFLFETGLAHNWHRTYDATIGRYLQADPLGFVDGPSVFSYATSAPTSEIDPTGLNRFRRPSTGPMQGNQRGLDYTPWRRGEFYRPDYHLPFYPPPRGLPPPGVLPPVPGVCTMGPPSRPSYAVRV